MRGTVDQSAIDTFESWDRQRRNEYLDDLGREQAEIFISEVIRNRRGQRESAPQATAPTESTKPTGSGSLGNTIGQTIATEGIKQGINAGLSSGAASQAPTILSATKGAAGTFSGGGAAASGGGSAAGTSSALSGGAATLGAAATAANLYNYGGRKVLSGNADAGDYADLALAVNPMTFWLNPTLDVLGMDSAGELAGLSHKSTDQYRQERYGDAANNAATDTDREFIEMSSQKREGDNGVFAAGPLAGRSYNWDEVKRFADGQEIAGEYAFQEAFPDWISGFSEEQRNQIAQYALDENLLESDKGQILASGKRGNLDRLRQIGSLVKEGAYQPIKTEEQREAERFQAAEELGVTYDPSKRMEDMILNSGGTQEDVDAYYAQQEGQDTSTQEQVNAEARTGIRRSRPSRPRPMNKIPTLDAPEEIAPVLPPPPEPELKSPKDYAQAYVDVFRGNQGLAVNPQLSGRY